jgi:hypothetical protein
MADSANAVANAFGLNISGSQWIGSGISTIGPGPSATPTLAGFQFAGGAGASPALTAALAQQGGVFASTDELTKFVTFVSGAYTQLQQTTAATNTYQTQIDALNASYASAITTAQGYGLATDKLTTAQTANILKIEQARNTAVAQAEQAVMATASGSGVAASLFGLSVGKQPALDQLQNQLESLGVSADEVAKYVKILNDALDVQYQNAVDALNLQIQTTTQQSAINAENARGQTYQAGVLKTSIDNAAAIKALGDTLKSLGISAADAQPWIDNLTSALTQQTAAAAAANQESIRQLSVQTQLRYEQALGVTDPAAKAAADLGALIESQYEDAKKQFDTMVAQGQTTDQITQAMATLNAAFKVERDNLQQQSVALSTSGQSIQDYINKLNATPAGGASPVNQYAAAQGIWSQQIALAGAGNATALGNITSNADSLQAAARLMFGSGAGYQTTVKMIETSLSALPATQAYNTSLLASAAAAGAAAATTAIVSAPTGDAALKISDFPVLSRSAMGRVFPFQGGGIFSQPTYAPMALFGEAGPEAIMPLRRDRSGRLGVTSGDDRGPDVGAAFAQVAVVLRDEIRLMRGDIQDLRSTLRRVVAQ